MMVTNPAKTKRTSLILKKKTKVLALRALFTYFIVPLTLCLMLCEPVMFSTCGGVDADVLVTLTQ
jgi:hypothetical protein